MQKMITTGFHGQDLIDIDINPESYRKLLKQTLELAFPDFKVEVTFSTGQSGVLPFSLQTHVYGVDDIDEMQREVDDVIASISIQDLIEEGSS